MTKVKVNDISRAIMAELNRFENLTNDVLSESANAASKIAVDYLKANSPKRAGGGDYAKSWTVNRERSLNTVENIIHVKKPHYRLTHLLEYGHVTRNGTSRTKAQPHIYPAEQLAIAEFENRLTAEIERIE